MNFPRIYHSGPLQLFNLVTLDKFASHHLFKVLRSKIGDQVEIFNGQGGAFRGVLRARQGQHVIVELEEFSKEDNESPLTIYLGQALSRQERMDYAIQKSVELGVSHIIPLITARCAVQWNQEHQSKRLLHWRQVVLSACEQCRRNRIPTLVAPQPLTTFLQQAVGLRLICHPDHTKSANLPQKVDQITLLIGPEGGFTAQEVQQAQQANFAALSLGPRILRTETAAVVSLAILQSRWGDI